MSNSIVGAILLTIASPVQVLLTAVFGIAYVAHGRKLSSQDHVYPHLELRGVTERIEFCVNAYGAYHPETITALAKRQSMFESFCKQKLLDAADQRMYLANHGLRCYD
jgi:hypothetical protein